MKVHRLFVREIGLVIALVCLFFLCVSQVQAQSSFSYPPIPTPNGNGVQWNGSAVIDPNGNLQLTPNSGGQVGSAWYTNPSGPGPAPLPLLNGFTTTFTFQFTGQGGIGDTGAGANGKAGADGITFVVQNGTFNNYNGDTSGGSTALGPSDGLGGELGFTGLTNSVAVQFDSWCNVEFGDTCATAASPTSADQITIESCGQGANTVYHNAGCSFGTIDLSRIANPIYIGDTNVHTAQISYSPPTATGGSCVPSSAFGTAGCGSLAVIVDGQTVLTVPFNLAYLGLDSNDDAYVGFTSATGGSWETHDILTWSFMGGVTSVVTQPIIINDNAPGPTITSNFSSTNTGGTVSTSSDYSTAGNGITSPISNPTFLSINNSLSQTTWPEYVVGTPWATSSCTAKSGNGGSGNLCSQYINECFDASMGATTASDANCPTVNDPGFQNYVTLEDTFDWGTGGKQPIAAGTTASLIAFTVPTTSPGLQWNASLPPATTNPVCASIPGTASPSCYLSDSLIDVFADQTTTRGSKPKSKAWLVSVYNVPMLTTSIFAVPNPSNTACKLIAPVALNNTASTVWVNGACLFDFQVNPAVASTPTNNFQAAPPASLLYGPGTPPIAPGPITTGDTLVSNPSPVCTGAGGNCAPAIWDTMTGSNVVTVVGGTIPASSPTLSTLGNNGSFPMHWSAIDLVGITEKNIQLVSSTTGCTLPNGSTVSGTQCYYTNYFTINVNIDSTAPSLTGYSFSPAGSPAGTFAPNAVVYPVYTCTDSLSGVATCGGLPVNGCPRSITVTSTTPLSPMTPGPHSYAVNATDCALNASGNTTVSYTVASAADVAIIGGTTSSTTKSITYVAALLDLTQSTSAYNVVLTFQITDPKASVGGPITGVFAEVSCSLFGCNALPSGPMYCSTSGDTVTCSVGTLPTIYQLKGAVAQITIPVVSKPASGATIGINASVSSANDPNLKNNTASATVSVK
jgi:hypothetical protein